MRAALYARRSTSDRDERQVQSIEDQVRIMTSKAEQEGVAVIAEITESKSAKEPYVRPEFERMLRLIDAGEVDCILCWHLNRLFRNSVDMSAIQWRLQKGLLRKIITPDRVYLPEDNVLLFYMEAGVSNQTVLDLSKAVKRGMNSKIDKGWFPHRAPAGYRNDKWLEKGQKTISPDPERFKLIQQAWQMMLSGNSTVVEVLDALNNKWHYRSLQTKRTGGAPLGRNTLYGVFTNIFYAGYFKHRGQLYQGAHPPMVTLKEFQRVQAILGRDSYRQPHKRDFAYTGMIRCTGCGGLVTAQTITKASGRSYSYYFCRNANRTCRKVGIREDKLEDVIDEQLTNLTLLPEFTTWGREEVQKWRGVEYAAQHAVYHQGLETLQATDRQLDSLLTLKIKELISDEEYIQRKTKLQNERVLLHGHVQELEQANDLAREAVENALVFIANARAWLSSGEVEVKRAIARALASNFRFTEGKVTIEPHPLLHVLHEEGESLRPEIEKIKLDEMTSQSTKNDRLEAVRAAWSRKLERIRRLALNDSLFFPRIQDEGRYNAA